MAVSADALIEGSHYYFLNQDIIYEYIGPSQKPDCYDFIVVRHLNGDVGDSRLLSDFIIQHLYEMPIPTSNEQALFRLQKE